MPTLETIRAGLQMLDALLRPAVAKAETAFGVKPGEDLFRRLYVERDEVDRVLGRDFQEHFFSASTLCDERVKNDDLFRELANRFPGFDAADYLLLLLAFAPEFDSEYEWIIAYLHDDVSRLRATIELAVSLFAAADRGQILERLVDVAPLLRHCLIELTEPPDNRSGVLGRVMKVDEQFSRWLLGMKGLDRRLAGAASLTDAATSLRDVPLGHAIRTSLERWTDANGERTCLRLYLYGADAVTRTEVAAALAQTLAVRRLTVDTSRLFAGERPGAETVRILMREAEWFNNLLFLDNVDLFHHADRQRDWELLMAAIVQHPGPVILAGARAQAPATSQAVWFMPLELAAPDADERLQVWGDSIKALPAQRIGATDMARLADRYPLTPAQISQATLAADAAARWRCAAGMTSEAPGPTYEDFAHAARLQGSHELASLTQRIVPRMTLDDLVVTFEVREQLGEIVARVQHRHWVLVEWGFGQRQTYGNGVNALFAGPSGTGKTMAAEAIAQEIGKFLYKIDLPSVVSKYIGETEQRLERIFAEAEAAQAVLFFDEADSLLGKRSEVRDAHDRYANLEISYLLQRMERFDGLILLATNLPGNLDDAFLRRMSAIVHFSAPAAPARRALWERVWPRHAPLASEPGYAIDYDFLAENFELTGGGIRNAALSAAFNAASRRACRFITMSDALFGVEREFRKLGQALSEDELGLRQFKQPPTEPPDSSELALEFDRQESLAVLCATEIQR